MAGLVRAGGMTYLESAANTGASSGIAVTAHATNANAYGDWAQLIAATSGPADYILLSVYFEKAGGTSLRNFRFDLGNGTNVIVDSACIEVKGDSGTMVVMGFPVHVPSGAQLQARCMASVAAEVLEMSVQLFGSGRFSLPGFTKAVSYGVSNSKGTNVDPGATPNTKPTTWTQLTASTNEDLAGFYVCVGNDTEASQALANWLLDIAIGASTSEAAIVENLLVVGNTLEGTKQPFFVPHPIPKGSRVSARCQCDIAVDGDRDLSVSITGFVR